jgi:hypothetical protein
LIIVKYSGWSETLPEVGTCIKWKETEAIANTYAEFSSFQSGNAVNVAWLIHLEVDLSNKQNQNIAF